MRTFDPRTLIALFILPLVGSLTSIAYYSQRAILFQYWSNDLGLSNIDAMQSFTVTRPAPIVGAAIALVLGPLLGGWGTLIAGVSVLTLGLMATGVLPGEIAWAPVFVSSMGRAMLTIGVIAALADSLRGRRVWLLAAGFSLYYLSTNAAGLFVPPLASEIYSAIGARAVFSTTAIVGGAGTLLAGASYIAWTLLRSRYPEPDPRRKRAAVGPHIGFLLVAIVGLPLTLLHMMSVDALTTSALNYGSLQTSRQMNMMLALNPTVVIAACLALVGAMAVLHTLSVRPTPLLGVALGATLAAVGSFLVLMSGSPVTFSALLWVGLAIAAAGEPVIASLLVAGYARDLHWRAVVPAMALWQGAFAVGVMAVPSSGLTFDPADPIGGLFVWVAAPAMLGLGLTVSLLGALARPLWRAPVVVTHDGTQAHT